MFYKKFYDTKLIDKCLWKIARPCMKYTHVGLAIGDAHFFFNKSNGSKVCSNKAVNKIKECDDLLFLGYVETDLKEIKEACPNYGPFTAFQGFCWGIVSNFKWFNYFGCKRVYFCNDVVCRVLNFYGIPIPDLGAKE